jgi:hypothetical protein
MRINLKVAIQIFDLRREIALVEMNLREEEVGVRERRFVEYRFARALLRLRESTHRVQHPCQGKVASGIGGIELDTLANHRLRLGKLLPVGENQAQPKVRRSERPITQFDAACWA